jgi:hypothetical protein
MQVIQLSRLLKWQRVMGYSARSRVSPAVFAESYPQPYPQVRLDRAKQVTGQQQGPPIAELQVWVRGTPQQKIFAKVKAAI